MTSGSWLAAAAIVSIAGWGCSGSSGVQGQRDAAAPDTVESRDSSDFADLADLPDLSGAEPPADVSADASTDGDAGPRSCVAGFAGTFEAVETGDMPRSVVVADFDRDGLADVAVAANAPSSRGRNLLTVARGRGRGQGAFGTPEQIPVGGYAVAVVAADFNRDGAPDLAVAIRDAMGVDVLLNRGDGTFAAPTRYATTGAPFAMVAADLDQDQRIDLVTAAAQGRGVAVLQGMGDGTFAIRRDYPVGGEPDGVAVGDMNEDGRPDLVVADNLFNATVVKTLLGQGGLEFASPTVATGMSGALGVAVADLDEDRHLDVVVTTYLGIVVLRGHGDGTYDAPVAVPIVDGTGLAVTDLDGDGHLDLAVTSGTWSGTTGDTVEIVRGRGDGTFLPAVGFHAGAIPDAVAVADFTGDGRADLVVANKTGANLALLVGVADGFLQPPTWAVPFPGQIALGDLNRDGHLDIVAGSSTVLLGSAGGGLGNPVNLTSSRRSFVVLDWTGDGVLDLVAEGSAQAVSVNPGLGDGSFGPQQTLPAPLSASLVTSADFDMDGKPDLALLGPTPSQLAVLYGDARGGVAATVTIDERLAYGQGAIAADFDGDGYADLAVCETFSTAFPRSFKIMRGGAGRTLTPLPSIAVTQEILRIAGGDIDRDGHPDLLVLTTSDGRSVAIGAQLGLFRGRGDGTFDVTWIPLPAWSSNNQSPQRPLDLAIADVDGTGAVELALLYLGRLEVWTLGGATAATRRWIYPQGGDHITAGDLDGDGAADLVLAREGAGQIMLLRSACR